MTEKYALGVDFGSDSVRALVVDVRSGQELVSSVAYYKRWVEGLYSDASTNRFRHHPLDYLEGLEECATDALSQLPKLVRENIVGIGVDTTGSTPSPVDKYGTPLALLAEFKDNPNAMFNLWKDHSAVQEAHEISNLAKTWGEVDYTKYAGGVYSSEWFWAKILHIFRIDQKVRNAAFSWVEACDWIPALLTGTENPSKMKRSRCAAGHKAMWHSDWGGLPPEEFLVQLDPLLRGLRERLYQNTYTSDHKAGKLVSKWANRLGLPEGIAVSVGALDAHVGAVGGGITENTLLQIMGTSTCAMMVVSPQEITGRLIAGICGQVDGSVIPGLIGLEAGQSAFGDVYAWFRDLLAWPLDALGSEIGISSQKQIEIKEAILNKLTKDATEIDPKQSSVLALDWLNGRRNPFEDQLLKGALLGLTLGTDAPRILKALIEATAFGSRSIVERFNEEGLTVDHIVAQGGIPAKNELVMQVCADVLNKPIRIVRSTQAVALGAAMFGATAAGVFKDVETAQRAMHSGYSRVFEPNVERAALYQELYGKYLAVGELLGGILRQL